MAVVGWLQLILDDDFVPRSDFMSNNIAGKAANCHLSLWKLELQLDRQGLDVGLDPRRKVLCFVFPHCACIDSLELSQWRDGGTHHLADTSPADIFGRLQPRSPAAIALESRMRLI